MSKNFQMTVKAFNGDHVNVEVFNSANEVVETSARRAVTDGHFHKMDEPGYIHEDFHGVKDFQSALELMRTGYQPAVEKLKAGIKANVEGQGKRISFFNDVVGFAPVVPLALQGVPASMMNSYMKPIKAKVLNVYYDMTACCDVTPEQILKAGQKVLSAIMELEMQGYKFNLYAIQSYHERGSCDVLCTKIKSSNTPLDLKRISFPMIHTAYFRVIGWDWYSKTPKGKYRSGYGRGLGYDFSEDTMQDGFKELFGQNCVVFSCAKILKKDVDHLKTIIENKGKEVSENG